MVDGSQLLGDYLRRIGTLIRDSRKRRGWTQAQLADALGTSQSAITRIEQGNQNLSLEMLTRIGKALDAEIVSLGAGVTPTNLRVAGGAQLTGSIGVKSSKNASVALLCAALLNNGRTTLRRVARIEEVNRILEVLAGMDMAAARRTRSIIMFLGPLMHSHDRFELPYAGGCALGTRTVEPHLTALRPMGLEVKATDGCYHAVVDRNIRPSRPIVLTERGDTVTENAIMAAARRSGT